MTGPQSHCQARVLSASQAAIHDAHIPSTQRCRKIHFHKHRGSHWWQQESRVDAVSLCFPGESARASVSLLSLPAPSPVSGMCAGHVECLHSFMHPRSHSANLMSQGTYWKTRQAPVITCSGSFVYVFLFPVGIIFPSPPSERHVLVLCGLSPPQWELPDPSVSSVPSAPDQRRPGPRECLLTE